MDLGDRATAWLARDCANGSTAAAAAGVLRSSCTGTAPSPLLNASSDRPLIATDSTGADLRSLYFGIEGILSLIVTLIGVVTNLANLIVLVRMVRTARASIYHILLAMAAADFGVMGVSLLYAARFHVRERPHVTQEDIGEPPLIDAPSYFFYHTWFYFANVCCTASNWCVVTTSAFRAIAVFFPFKTRTLTSRRRARAVLAVVFVLSVVVNVPDMMSVTYVDGSFRRNSMAYINFFLPLTFIMHITPWLLCAAAVALILVGLRINRVTSGSKKHRRLTYLFVALAASFVVTTAPTVVYVFLVVARHSESVSDFVRRPGILLFQAVAKIVLLCNYCSNFFMYALIDSRYRKFFVAAVLCRKISDGAVSDSGTRTLHWKHRRSSAATGARQTRAAAPAMVDSITTTGPL